MRATLLSGLLVAAVACAKPPRPTNMAPGGVPVADRSVLRGAVAVGAVTGGERTNALTYSRVSADDVRAALVLGLRARGMLAATSAPFRLDVGILEMTLPGGPYVTRVHAVLRYALRFRDGSTRFDRVVDTTGEASVPEVYYGGERLRVANERAIRANLAVAFDDLVAADRSGALAPTAATAP